jgi:sugar-specific transcriptional regulator TrmB
MYTIGMDWKNKSFKIFSLTETESTVLNVLDTPKNVQNLARNSSLSRTGVNHVLENLIDKGLVRFEWLGKRRIYSAVTLDQLSEKFRKTLEEIEIANPDKKGAKIKISKENEFIVHVGSGEIIPAYKRIASENKNGRIRAIQHHRSWNGLIEKISPEQLVEFNESIKRNHIILDGMLNRSAYKAYGAEIKNDPEKHTDAIKSLEGRMADYTVFSDEFFNYDTEIWIFKTTTLIINWKEEVAIEITNSNMTGFFKDMFEFVKEGGSKLDHNHAIRDILK